jgi:hypothetical protein
VVEFGGLFFCASAVYSVEKVLSLGGSDGTPSPTQSDEDKLTGRILQLAKGTLPTPHTGSISSLLPITQPCLLSSFQLSTCGAISRSW